jgi:curved DNA-binding protein CbpA
MRPRQYAHLEGQDAYEILGVPRTADRAHIDAARRALVKAVHPDRPGGDANRMALVNSAADILLDDDQRRDYDAYLAEERGAGTAGRQSARGPWRRSWSAAGRSGSSRGEAPAGPRVARGRPESMGEYDPADDVEDVADFRPGTGQPARRGSGGADRFGWRRHSPAADPAAGGSADERDAAAGRAGAASSPVGRGVRQRGAVSTATDRAAGRGGRATGWRNAIRDLVTGERPSGPRRDAESRRPADSSVPAPHAAPAATARNRSASTTPAAAATGRAAAGSAEPERDRRAASTVGDPNAPTVAMPAAAAAPPTEARRSTRTPAGTATAPTATARAGTAGAGTARAGTARAGTGRAGTGRARTAPADVRTGTGPTGTAPTTTGPIGPARTGTTRAGTAPTATGNSTARGPAAPRPRRAAAARAAGPYVGDEFTEDLGDEPGAPRRPLKWQPPPPSRLARRRLANRASQAGHRPSRRLDGPTLVILILVGVITICAIAGALLGYTVHIGGGSSPASSPAPHRSAPAHPGTQKPFLTRTTPARKSTNSP